MKINKLISVLLAAAFSFSTAYMPASCGLFAGIYAYSAEASSSADKINGATATTTIKPEKSTGSSSSSGANESCLNGFIYLLAGVMKSASAEPFVTTVTAQTEPVTTFTTTTTADRLPDGTDAAETTVVSTEDTYTETTTTSTVVSPPDEDNTETTTTSTTSIDDTVTTTTPPILTTTTTTTTTTVTTTTTTTTTNVPTPTVTTTTTTTTTTPPQVNLIMQCSISCSDEPGVLLISGKTQGVQRLEEVGFRNLRILRSSDGVNWTVEKNLGTVTDKNALTCVLDRYEVRVNGGAYYSVSCEHYAQDDGYEQTVYNTSSYVWIEKAEPIVTTSEKDDAITNQNATTTKRSGINNAEKDKIQANAAVNESSPETGQRGIGMTFAVMITAISAALIVRKRDAE